MPAAPEPVPLQGAGLEGGGGSSPVPNWQGFCPERARSAIGPYVRGCGSQVSGAEVGSLPCSNSPRRFAPAELRAGGTHLGRPRESGSTPYVRTSVRPADPGQARPPSLSFACPLTARDEMTWQESPVGPPSRQGSAAPGVVPSAVRLRRFGLRQVRRGVGQSRPFSSSSSPICTAFSAAPLRRLSETTQRSRPCSTERSSRMRPT